MSVKLCIRCDTEKPLTAFYKNKINGGYYSGCKKCRNARTVLWQSNNKSRTKETNKASSRRYVLKKKYGLTVEKFEQMKKDRNNCCDICGLPETRMNKSLAIDHCHDTGEVRGLLCGGCNTGIGNLRDDPTLLIRGAEYILKYRKSHERR